MFSSQNRVRKALVSILPQKIQFACPRIYDHSWETFLKVQAHAYDNAGLSGLLGRLYFHLLVQLAYCFQEASILLEQLHVYLRRLTWKWEVLSKHVLLMSFRLRQQIYF